MVSGGSVEDELAALLRTAREALGQFTTARPTAGQPGHETGHESGQIPTTCGVCPICLGIAALARSHPDVLVHLGEAARSLAAAAACLTQQGHPAEPAGREADGAGQGGHRPPQSGRGPGSAEPSGSPIFERIEISD